MKSYLVLFFCILLLSVSIISCDYVDNPYPQTVGGDTTGFTAFTFTANPSPFKKVLVEDYTGFRCPNCPKAGDELASILASHPDSVIGMGVHVSVGFAEPAVVSGAPAGSFQSDFRTPEGDNYDNNIFRLSTGVNGGLPKGMINRKDYINSSSGTHKKSYISAPTWETEVNTLLAQPPDIDLQIHNEYDTVSKILRTQIYSRFLNSLSGNYKLAILITEDSIYDWQIDNRLASPSVTQYWHRHVLRTSINSNDGMGESIANGTIAVITKRSYTFTPNIGNIPCNADKCHVVAFIYNAANLEILQVEEEKVK